LGIQSVIIRTVTVAGGRFAPGHLGELTQLVPFEMVDEALVQTGRMQSRVRDLPSRVVVYLLLAACLFPEVGYRGVWQKLTAGLDGLPVAVPTPSALLQARRRVGVAPLRWLFDLLRGPAAVPRGGGGTWWRGLLVCAVDGTTMTVPDSPASLTRFTRQAGNHGGGGYPQVRLLALVACATRTLIDVVFGPATRGETTYAAALLPSLRQGMLMLADRNFAAGKLIAAIAATRADMLVRVKTGRGRPEARHRAPPRRRLLPVTLRRCAGAVIDAQITITTTAGLRTGRYRLATTLLDHHRYPAAELIRLYHQRWQIETTYLELKSTMPGGRVLRARTPAGIDQEIYALLVTYQLLCTAMVDATTTHPGTDPSRASFTIAWHTARDQLIQAARVTAGTTIDLAGTIGRHILAHLLPARRLRISPRIVKRAISQYQARGPRIDRASYKATIGIDILTPLDERQPASTTRPWV
jgi:hypothetical protein